MIIKLMTSFSMQRIRRQTMTDYIERDSALRIIIQKTERIMPAWNIWQKICRWL